MTVEERRCERLRNLLTPLYNLAQMVKEGDDNLKNLIQEEAENVLKTWHLIEKALDPNAKLEELNRLYSEFHQDNTGKKFFKDAEEFNQFMVNEKPLEIWFDEFMENEPYIILSFNDGVKFRGVYNRQALLAGDNSDFRWLFKEGIYVKLPIS